MRPWVGLLLLAAILVGAVVLMATSSPWLCDSACTPPPSTGWSIHIVVTR